jgi:hypothetical protein
MRQTRVLTIAALAIVSMATAACGARQVETAGGDVALADSTSIIVNNQGLLDMTMYVLEGGSLRRRLGTANGLTRTRIAIPRSLVGNGRDLQFLADPIGARGNSVSQRIFVSPGDQVGLTILP